LDRMRRLRIAVVSDAVYPYHRGGKEMRYAQLLPRLQESVDVDVYTMHWWSNREATQRDRGIVYHAICPLISLYGKARRSIWQAVAFAIACLRLLNRPFDALEADHVPNLQLFTLRLVTWLRRRPLVVTWHEVWGPGYWRQYLGRRTGAVAWWLERTAMLMPDEIVAASPGTGARLRALLGDGTPPVRDVPSGIDLGAISRVQPLDPEQSPDLLFVGRLIAHKHADLFIEAFARLSDTPNLRGLIVGDGPERMRLRQLADDLGVEDSVRFRHDIESHDEVIALMKGSRVLVFPSFREGFGIVALEALACGTPVVMTAHPDNEARKFADRSSLCYLADPTVEGLVTSIERALADFPRRAPAGAGDAAGSDHVGQRRYPEPWISDFDWSMATAAYLQTFSDLVERGPARGGRNSRTSAAFLSTMAETSKGASAQSPLEVLRKNRLRSAPTPDGRSIPPRRGGSSCSRV